MPALIFANAQNIFRRIHQKQQQQMPPRRRTRWLDAGKERRRGNLPGYLLGLKSLKPADASLHSHRASGPGALNTRRQRRNGFPQGLHEEACYMVSLMFIKEQQCFVSALYPRDRLCHYLSLGNRDRRTEQIAQQIQKNTSRNMNRFSSLASINHVRFRCE